MKFARYLEETQVPEWKKAYIDYRGLKKRINAIRAAQDEEGTTPLLQVSPAADIRDVQTHLAETSNPAQKVAFAIPERPQGTGAGSSSDTDGKDVDETASGSLPLRVFPSLGEPLTESPESTRASHESQVTDMNTDDSSPEDAEHPHLHAHFEESVPSSHPRDDHAGASRPSVSRSTSATLNMGFLPRLRRRSTGRSIWDPSRRSTNVMQWDLAKSIPLKDLVPMLKPVQREFFRKLDAELDKVESFYVEREKEMRIKTDLLKVQLEELKDHGRLYFQAHNTPHSWIPAMMRRKPVNARLVAVETLTRKRRSYKDDSSSPSRPTPGRRPGPPIDSNKALEQEIENVDSVPMRRAESAETAVASGSGGSGGSGEEERRWKRFRPGFPKRNFPKAIMSSPTPAAGFLHRHDPEDYLHARKRLKKAVLEGYRGLEVLENYRTLNIIGFRKALKKFEKCTKIPAQQAYFLEKIEPSAFSSGAAVQAMLSQLEGLYAARFAHGDPKAAKTRLRGQAQQKTHHFSTFRTGLLVGLALPALVDGIYLSFQSDTRRAIPGYDGLLFVYSIFFVPVVFSLLVGVNLLVWSRTRINYIFIFELDVKTRLDHREYFETPALLLSTLCYAFWLSFARIGGPHFNPVLWPLIWLAFVAIVIFDPLPVLFKTSRWWLIKNVSRLLTSGMHRVEFADFWMGDQFCSLVFTLSNLYFVVCGYSRSFDEDWQRCNTNSGRTWGVPFVLAIIPFVVRLVQSVKRWVDSGLVTHLINGGKYGTGIIYYLCYYIWRHQGGKGASFAVWCIFGTIYAVYASAWDLLMDWSVLRPRAHHPFLREEMLYTGYIPLYYFAIATNVLIRFIWVFYIPERGPSMQLRTFIAAMLEMLRRIQWNFIRLENEHIGNMDQYRVTREVPLPYSFDDVGHDSDGDEDDDRRSLSSWKKRKAKQPMLPAENEVVDRPRDDLDRPQSR